MHTRISHVTAVRAAVQAGKTPLKEWPTQGMAGAKQAGCRQQHASAENVVPSDSHCSPRNVLSCFWASRMRLAVLRCHKAGASLQGCNQMYMHTDVRAALLACYDGSV